MPIYDYRCGSCGNRFDVRQGFSDDPSAVCPKCQGAAQRVLHPVGIVFKGSGWHSTDYRGKAGGGSSTSDSSSESKAESKTETKTDSKADTKTEPSTAGSSST
jgi:putative FmdB family regulatory protein